MKQKVYEKYKIFNDILKKKALFKISGIIEYTKIDNAQFIIHKSS